MFIQSYKNRKQVLNNIRYVPLTEVPPNAMKLGSLSSYGYRLDIDGVVNEDATFNENLWGDMKIKKRKVEKGEDA